jgi:uncharacterized membrane protein
MKLILRLLLAALFAFAGIVHLVDPTLFLPVMPPWIPLHLLCIQVSGVFELLGAGGLLMPEGPVRRIAGWGLNLLLIAVFPANVYMAAEHIQVHGIPSQSWMGWARLPFQPLLMWGIAWVTDLWPRRKIAIR